MTKPQYTIVESRDCHYPAKAYIVRDADGNVKQDRDGEYLWADKASAREFIRELGGVEAKKPKAGKP